jgi:sialate O-acetylesterase
MKLSLFTIAICTLATTCLLVTPVRAEVRLASVITDHAVLQRDAPIHLWGEASPAEKISMHFHDQSVVTTASHMGLWEAWLMPEPAGGPFTLTVRGSSELTRSDLLVGDVWFASGQSNMEMPLSGFPPTAHITNAAQEIAQADLPQVRLLRMENKSSDSPLTGISAVWQPCTPDTAKDFSAVAYFFAREKISLSGLSIHRGEALRLIPGSASSPSRPMLRSCPRSLRGPTSPICRHTWSS